MWWRCISWLAVGILGATPLVADTRDAAFIAQSLLGPDVWSQVLQIECARPGSDSPTVMHALVFELEQQLWYYAADSGTQSLSLFRGRLAQDKAKLDDLLRAIEPGFVRYRTLKAPPGPLREELPHGCFIACVAYLRMIVAEGRVPDDARLVAYYGKPAGDSRGHTVLYFTRGSRRYIFDPARSIVPQPVPADVPVEPLAIALAAAPGEGYAPPQRAVFLPLHLRGLVAPTGVGRKVAAGRAAGNGPEGPVRGG